jgi:hypothetical protein
MTMMVAELLMLNNAHAMQRDVASNVGTKSFALGGLNVRMNSHLQTQHPFFPAS